MKISVITHHQNMTSLMAAELCMDLNLPLFVALHVSMFQQ